MSSYNRVILMGNLTRDPELKYTPKGTATARIGIAVNRKWKDDSGQEKEEVTFVDVDVWGKQAEVVGQYCRKGKALLVEGRLKLDQWDDKATGQKRSAMRVVMESFQFISSGKRDDADAAAPKPAAKVKGPTEGYVPTNDPLNGPPMPGDDDVPF